MLKVDIHEEPHGDATALKVAIEGGGTVANLCSDIGRVILTVYANIYQRTPLQGDMFRYAITAAISDPDFWKMTGEVSAGEGISILTVKN